MSDLHFMPHQEEVLNLTDDKNRCAYYLDMGLGKTLQVMTLIEDGIGENHVSLVVAPATLIYNWQDEIKQCEPDRMPEVKD